MKGCPGFAFVLVLVVWDSARGMHVKLCRRPLVSQCVCIAVTDASVPTSLLQSSLCV